ncbi:MAG TPA: heavy metal sensor histidine kinase [Blastocatellia bacterium]|nr:heavy metal sensor histidine kinase [Blastocatellia bacterium]
MNTRSIQFRLTVWYGGLLAGLLILFSLAVYMGLWKYLTWTLEGSLANQARQIGETLLFSVSHTGEDYVVEEIDEHFAPEMNNRYVRVTRDDNSVLYASGQPEDKSFDPSGLPLINGPVNGGFSRSEHLAQGNELLIYTLPFTADDGNRFLIEIGAPYGQIESVLHGLLLTLVIGLPLIIAVAIAGGYALTRRALKPVDRIRQSAEQITSRNLNERLPVARTGDELERLSVSLNHMIARLDEAFEHTRRFTADASHELRTPLTVLRGELEVLAQKHSLSADVRETVGSALEEVERLSKIVESLLTMSRLDAGEARMELAKVNLAELVTTTAEQMRLLADDKNISLSCVSGKRIEVEGDPVRLKQVVVNLLDNAIKYTPERGQVNVAVSADNGSAVLEVSDTGTGIPAESLHHVFERFYRVDKARSRQMGGTGLGLAIVKSICNAHGGSISVKSVEGKGSSFRVELPLADGCTKDY